jgi:hypothetical protein
MACGESHYQGNRVAVDGAAVDHVPSLSITTGGYQYSWGKRKVVTLRSHSVITHSFSSVRV